MATTTTGRPRTSRAIELCHCGKPKGHIGRHLNVKAETETPRDLPPIAGGSNGHEANGNVATKALDKALDKKAPAVIEEELFDSKLLGQICMKVKGDGFVPREVLEETYGHAETSQAIALLYRTYRIFTEVRRKWGPEGEEKIGYVWATEGLTNKKMKKLPAFLGFLEKLVDAGGPRYKDYEGVTVRCQWTNYVLAGLPRGKEQEERLFERDADGSVLIPAYCVRAMFKKALPMIGAEAAVAERIHIAAVRVKEPKVVRLKMPVVDMSAAPGHRGKGINEHEALGPGTKFELECIIPTSVIDPEDFVRMVAFSGKFCRLSPARSSGYGDFVVLDQKKEAA